MRDDEFKEEYEKLKLREELLVGSMGCTPDVDVPTAGEKCFIREKPRIEIGRSKSIPVLI